MNMKQLLLAPCAILAILALSSCDKQKIDTELQKKMNFDWDLTKAQMVSHEGTYDVINQNGDTIAIGLSGQNILRTAGGDELTAVPSKTAETKAGSSSTIYFPTDKEYANYWAEDNFPFVGDKDFNDVVFRMRYVFKITDGYVTTLQADVNCVASGSSFDLLGIALQLDGVNPSDVSSSGGYFKTDFRKLFDVNNDYIENGTTPAVVPIIGDFRNTYQGGRVEGLVNTFSNLEFHPTRNQFSIKITMKTQITYEELYAALNPFVVIGERGKEIHLKGKAASSKFNTSKFDESFVAEDGFVWLMMIPKKLVKYPLEMVSIYEAFPQFDEWVFIEAQSRNDWYMSPDETKVYTKNN